MAGDLKELNSGIRYGNSLVSIDIAAERRLRRKLDLHVTPSVALLYLLCFLDRINIGSAPEPR